MKRFLTSLLVMSVSLASFADEGMWLLPLLEKMNIKTMQEMGCRLSAEEIYSINNTSLKDAVVIFGNGCTGEVVSDQGLVLTNHHCGYSSIQQLSSVEHNYLADGYWAGSLSEEIPVPGLTVTFLDTFIDVTDALKAAEAECKKEKDAVDAVMKLHEELTSQLEAQKPGVTARIVPFYGGNAYYLIGYKRFTDIRFVGAPPSSIGKFGADTDNWMWPRHTCDFSMFRIYADKDGNPARYSADNVPYVPEKSLKVSVRGINEGDFQMIMGFPGSTDRYMTVAELQQRRDIENAIRIKCRGVRQEVLLADMLADPKVKIQYASKYSRSSNYWKNSIGMNEAIERLGVEQKCRDREIAFTEWANADKDRAKKYGKVIEDQAKAIKAEGELITVMNYLGESLNTIEITAIAGRVDGIADDAGLVRKAAGSFYKDYSMPTDRKVAVKMIELFREDVSAKNWPKAISEIDKKFDGNVGAYVDDLFDKSIFTSEEKLLENLEKEDFCEIVKSDPATVLRNSVMDLADDITARTMKIARKMGKANKATSLYIAGLTEMAGDGAIYPDANFTMRLTYGKVLPYSPKDGIRYNYYTTLTGVMEKEDPDNWEFVVPERLKELYAAKDFGEYARPDGTMPACFINTCDITGGNSGSPVLDADGCLVGLAFDGNWESLSGDIIFEPEYQRCIGVDVRYVLFIIDKFGGAHHLIEEMDIVR